MGVTDLRTSVDGPDPRGSAIMMSMSMFIVVLIGVAGGLAGADRGQ